MNRQLPVLLPLEVVARIYELSSGYAKFQLSRVFGICFRMWKQSVVDNVCVMLCCPLHERGFADTQRTLKISHDNFESMSVACTTVHVHVTAEALGQYLVLSPRDRRAVGKRYAEFLVAVLDDYKFDHVSVLLQHDADLKAKDFVALRDLLWEFPTIAWDLADVRFTVDAQWWITTYPSNVKLPRLWHSWQSLGKDPDDVPTCLDSLTAFEQ